MWLVGYIADLLEVAPAAIDTSKRLDRYGLDSVATVGLIGVLADWLDRELDPALVYEYPSIDALAKYLARE